MKLEMQYKGNHYKESAWKNQQGAIHTYTGYSMHGHIVGCELPALDSLCRARVVKKAQSIMSNPGHPVHELFVMLSLGRRLRASKSGCKRTQVHDSFYFRATLMLFDPTNLFKFHFIVYTWCIYIWQ